MKKALVKPSNVEKAFSKVTRSAGFILRERFGKTLYRRKMPKKSSTTGLIRQVVLQETRRMF